LVLVAAVGFACGARFSGTTTEILQAVGFFMLVLCASAGIGLIIGTFVKGVQGAVMTGVGIVVVTAALSGLFAPYRFLPSLLQQFARGYPLSSANSLINFVLLGEEAAGYNPLTLSHVSATVALSLLLLILGTVLYSRLSWKAD